MNIAKHYFWISIVLALKYAGADYYVATNGSDSASGTTPQTAWRTISHALSSMPDSVGTLHIAPGSYPERLHLPPVSTSSSKQLEVLAAPGTIIDASGMVVSNGMDALIDIEGRRNIVISGFELRNFSTATRDHVPIGIYIHGACTNIALQDLKIHDINTLYDDGGDDVRGGDAHGIAVYGDNPQTPITSVNITTVEIYSCKLGSSEALVLNGNVSGFNVSDCKVHDVNNIGIVFIGHEGTCADAQYDQARNGVCRSNLVYNICTTGNPAYRSGSIYDRSADGIYVDGGTRIIIEQNTIHDCDICLEVASEHDGKSTSLITVRNNLLTHGYTGGLFCGGYDHNRGSAIDCKFIGNTLYHNNTAKDYSGEITLQYHITNCIFRNNLLIALKNDGGDAVFFGGPGGSDSLPTLSSVDYNWYWSDESSSPSWRWGDAEYYSIASWRGAGHDAHGTYGINPMLRNPQQDDYHLTPKSPAINCGEIRDDTGSQDIDGEPRKSGNRPDIGADEFHKSNTGWHLSLSQKLHL